jgi:MOB kinase activator 1
LVLRSLVCFLSHPSGSKQTFRPIKEWSTNSKRAALKQHQMETLGLGNFRLAVRLPEGEDINEWYAVNIVDFWNQISMLYSTTSDYCTATTCPVMCAGPCYKYLWQENRKSKPVELPAPSYIGLLMDWVGDQFHDEGLFPSELDTPFPKHFERLIKIIMKRLFRVYAHLYYHHLNELKELNVIAHMNTSFKHFIFFVAEFQLIPQEQLKPLSDLIGPILMA